MIVQYLNKKIYCSVFLMILVEIIQDAAVVDGHFLFFFCRVIVEMCLVLSSK